MSSGLGVLTANLVLQKTKLDNLKHVKKLNVCGVHVSDIGVLRDAPNVEVLSLSVNAIDQLDALSEAYNLRELYLRKNCITDLNQALHLAKLPYLASLSMSENPVSTDPHYRQFLIAALPNLVRLDEQEVTQWERDEAERIFPSLRHMPAPAPSSSSQACLQGSPPRPSLSTPRVSSAVMQRERDSPPQSGRPSSSMSMMGRPSAAAAPGDYSTMYDEIPVGSRRAAAKRQQANEFAAAPQQRSAPAMQQQQQQQQQSAAPTGPREEGVVSAVKVLLNELSPASLLELRRHIDNALRN